MYRKKLIIEWTTCKAQNKQIRPIRWANFGVQEARSSTTLGLNSWKQMRKKIQVDKMLKIIDDMKLMT